MPCVLTSKDPICVVVLKVTKAMDEAVEVTEIGVYPSVDYLTARQ